MSVFLRWCSGDGGKITFSRSFLLEVSTQRFGRSTHWPRTASTSLARDGRHADAPCMTPGHLLFLSPTPAPACTNRREQAPWIGGRLQYPRRRSTPLKNNAVALYSTDSPPSDPRGQSQRLALTAYRRSSRFFKEPRNPSIKSPLDALGLPSAASPCSGLLRALDRHHDGSLPGLYVTFEMEDLLPRPQDRGAFSNGYRNRRTERRGLKV